MIGSCIATIQSNLGNMNVQSLTQSILSLLLLVSILVRVGIIFVVKCPANTSVQAALGLKWRIFLHGIFGNCTQDRECYAWYEAPISKCLGCIMEHIPQCSSSTLYIEIYGISEFSSEDK